MHQLILSLVLSLLFFHPSGGAKKSDREYDGLKGDVRAVRIEESRFKDRSGEWVEEAREINRILKYNAQGDLAEDVTFMQGRAWSKLVCSYDAEGNRIEEIVPLVGSATPKTEPQRQRRVFKYNDDGRRTEESLRTDAGKLIYKYKYAYDSKGVLREVTSYGREGFESLKCSVKYDEKGEESERNCRETYYSSTKQTFTYEFDSAGNWIKRIETESAFIDKKQVDQGKSVTYRIIVYGSSQDEATIRNAIAKLEYVPPPSKPPNPIIIRKSGGVLAREALKRVTPKYPRGLRNIDGQVLVEIVIDEQGKVISARAVSGPQELQERSLTAAKAWEFRPTTLSGVPVKVIGIITFDFGSR